MGCNHGDSELDHGLGKEFVEEDLLRQVNAQNLWNFAQALLNAGNKVPFSR